MKIRYAMLGLLALILLVPFGASAQAPEKMSYQAVVRNNNGELIKRQSVGMRISILRGAASGAAVYVETHTPLTNDYGLVSLEIGGGTAVTGAFSDIEWELYNHYVKVEIDPNGGSNYTLESTSPFLSVPYALHAKSAGSLAGSSGPFYLGQDTLGGIVFHLYIGDDGLQHGLIVAKEDSVYTFQTNPTLMGATSTWDGASNTALLGTSSPIVSYVQSFGPDWYLPSRDELMLLFNFRYHANRALDLGGFKIVHSNVGQYPLWTSTENANDSSLVFVVYMANGMPNYFLKTNSATVRAIRKF